MRTVIAITVLLHGFIHLLGFVKGFGIMEVRELTLPITKPAGMLWLIAAMLIILFSVLYFTNYEYNWIIGFPAIILSQILIILSWHDAGAGTVPNIIILLVSIASFGSFNFQKLVSNETTRLLSQVSIRNERKMSEADISGLPVPVKNWLLHSGAVGKPFVTMGKVCQQAKMKMKPGQQNWMDASARQYSTINPPGFVWTVDAKMNTVLHFTGRDKYVDGTGEMLIRVNSLINVVKEQGPKLNEATMQRYLGEMVWFPSMALAEHITWEQADDTTAIATMDYRGTSARGTFYFSPDGDFKRFSAFRYMGNEPEAKRHEWVLNVEEYRTFNGIKVPSRMTATWKLAEGDWSWLILEINDIKYNDGVVR